MSTSKNKIENKQSKDPIDQVIFEKGLRISYIVPVKEQDSLVIFLNNQTNFTVRLSSFPRLKKASTKQLNDWKLISKGIGIEWTNLDEDLSLKGFIQELIVLNTLKYVSGENTFAMAA